MSRLTRLRPFNHESAPAALPYTAPTDDATQDLQSSVITALNADFACVERQQIAPWPRELPDMKVNVILQMWDCSGRRSLSDDDAQQQPKQHQSSKSNNSQSNNPSNNQSGNDKFAQLQAREEELLSQQRQIYMKESHLLLLVADWSRLNETLTQCAYYKSEFEIANKKYAPTPVAVVANASSNSTTAAASSKATATTTKQTSTTPLVMHAPKPNSNNNTKESLAVPAEQLNDSDNVVSLECVLLINKSDLLPQSRTSELSDAEVQHKLCKMNERVTLFCSKHHIKYHYSLSAASDTNCQFVMDELCALAARLVQQRARIAPAALLDARYKQRVAARAAADAARRARLDALEQQRLHPSGRVRGSMRVGGGGGAGIAGASVDDEDEDDAMHDADNVEVRDTSFDYSHYYNDDEQSAAAATSSSSTTSAATSLSATSHHHDSESLSHSHHHGHHAHHAHHNKHEQHSHHHHTNSTASTLSSHHHHHQQHAKSGHVTRVQSRHSPVRPSAAAAGGSTTTATTTTNSSSLSHSPVSQKKQSLRTSASSSVKKQQQRHTKDDATTPLVAAHTQLNAALNDAQSHKQQQQQQQLAQPHAATVQFIQSQPTSTAAIQHNIKAVSSVSKTSPRSRPSALSNNNASSATKAPARKKAAHFVDPIEHNNKSHKATEAAAIIESQVKPELEQKTQETDADDERSSSSIDAPIITAAPIEPGQSQSEPQPEPQPKPQPERSNSVFDLQHWHSAFDRHAKVSAFDSVKRLSHATFRTLLHELMPQQVHWHAIAQRLFVICTQLTTCAQQQSDATMQQQQQQQQLVSFEQFAQILHVLLCGPNDARAHVAMRLMQAHKDETTLDATMSFHHITRPQAQSLVEELTQASPAVEQSNKRDAIQNSVSQLWLATQTQGDAITSESFLSACIGQPQLLHCLLPLTSSAPG